MNAYLESANELRIETELNGSRAVNDNMTTTTKTNHPQAISSRSSAEASQAQSQSSSKMPGTNDVTATSTTPILHYLYVNRALSFFANTLKST